MILHVQWTHSELQHIWLRLPVSTALPAEVGTVSPEKTQQAPMLSDALDNSGNP
jgi:hypothetical protein